MRRTLLLAIIFHFAFCIYGQELKVTSNVTDAIIYLNGAFINRSASADIKKGNNKVNLIGLPGTLIPATLQIQGKGNFELKTIQIFAENMIDFTVLSKAKMVDDSINLLLKKIKKNEISLKVLQEEESLLKKNQPAFSPQYVVKTVELKEVIDYNRTKLTEIYQSIENLAVQKNELLVVLKELKKNSNSLHSLSEKKTYTIEAEIISKFDQKGDFVVTYFTPFVSWFPIYDLKVPDISKPINMAMKSSIIQNTGEDWENVKISISNGTPSLSETYHELSPWFLSFYNYQNTTAQKPNPNVRFVKGTVSDENGIPLIGANLVINENNEVGTITDVDGKYYLPVPFGAKQIVISYTGYETKTLPISSEHIDIILQEGKLLDEIVVLGTLAGSINESRQKADVILKDFSNMPSKISYQPTTFSYDLKERFSFPNSTTENTIEIMNNDIPAMFDYYTVPKYDPSVFLTAKIDNWQEYNLLDGKVNLYLEGKFVGQTDLNSKLAGDTLSISLGRDKSIVVERTKVKEFAKKSFISGNITITKSYALTIKNNKMFPIRIKMQDQFPISTDKSIDIFDLEAKTSNMDADSRILTWDMEINPKTEITKVMKYTVKYPANRNLVLE